MVIYSYFLIDSLSLLKGVASCENDKNTKSVIENIKKEIKLNKDRRSRMKKQLDILNAKAKGEKVTKTPKKITKKKTIEKKPKKGSKSTKKTSKK